MSTLPAATHEQVIRSGPVALNMQRAAAQGITPQDILRIIRRRLALILLVWVAVIGLTAALTYVWMVNWPSYRASALIQVESTEPEKPYGGGMWDNRTFVKDQVERALGDQAMMIKSLTVLQDTLENPAVRETYWWREEVRQEPTVAMLELQGELSAAPLRDRNIIQVAYSTRKIDDAPVIVNAVVQHYFERLNQSMRGRFAEELRGLEDEVNEAQRQLNAKIAEIENYTATDAAIPGIMDQQTVVTDKLMRLGAMLTEAQARMEALRSQYDAYQQAGVEKMPVTPEIIQAVESDPLIANLEMRRTGLAEQKALLLERFGPGHRSVEEVESRIATVAREAESRRREKIDQYKSMQMERARLDTLMATDQVHQIAQKYSEAEAAQTDLDRKRARLENLDDEKRRAEERLDKSRKALDELNYVVSKPTPVRIKRMQNATRPLERSSPRWKVTLPAGFVLGLMLGVGLALLLEFANTSVRTPVDIVRHAAMPVLGMVPELDDEEVHVDDVEMVTRRAPRSMIAECFRRTRTNLMFSCPPDRQRTVLITSAQPEEGKTAVAVNLAVVHAQAGRKVLLVDCNFRRPALNKAFPQMKKQGLSNLLIGQCELKDLVNNTEIPTLDVIGSGPTPPNPAELLGSSYFRAFLAEAASQYDQVLLDGPPALLVSDGIVAAAAVDGVVIVTRAGETSRGALKRLRDTLDRVGVHVLGVVLNAAETQVGGYFKEMYRSYYDYDEQASQVLPGPSAAGKGSGPADAEVKV